MKTNETVNLTVSMKVTIPQALALKAMFEYWNQLSNLGSSREVAFYVDGDGNFHPQCKVTTDVELPELTDELKKLPVKRDNNGSRLYDYDNLAWYLSESNKLK
jgi:hypothetical protein